MMADKYVRVTKTVDAKGNLVKPEDVRNQITDDSDYYESTYYYNEEQKEKFDEKHWSEKFNAMVKNGAKGLKDVKTDKIWWDFDSKDNIELARQDALTVLDRLRAYGIDTHKVEIYFSGNKGFNVIVNITNELSPSEVRDIACTLASDLKSFDPSLYDHPQLLRIPGTKHQTSGLYKIQLSENQLKGWPLENIKEAAKKNQTMGTFVWQQQELDAALLKPVEKEKPKAIKEVQTTSSKPPKGWKPEKWALVQGEFASGERNEACLIILDACRVLGYDQIAAYYIAKGALKRSHDKYGKGDYNKEELWSQTERIYSDDWDKGAGHESYKLENSPFLQKLCERLGIRSQPKSALRKFADLRDAYKKYIKEFDKNRIYTGIKTIDDNIELTTGVNLGLYGAPGSGKTTLALNILNHTSKNNVHSVFASLDMNPKRMYEKALLKVAAKLSREEIREAFKHDKEQDIHEEFMQEFGNVHFFHKSAPSVSHIKEYIIELEEEYGIKIQLLVLDYFERVMSEFDEDTQNSKRVAAELQDLVNELDIAVVTLVQPTKEALSQGLDQPLIDYTKIKGSLFVAQSFRNIISVWRPFYTLDERFRKNDKYIKLGVLKNDLGEINEFTLAWDGRTSTIKDLLPHELQAFEKAMQHKTETLAGQQNGQVRRKGDINDW